MRVLCFLVCLLVVSRIDAFVQWLSPRTHTYAHTHAATTSTAATSDAHLEHVSRRLQLAQVAAAATLVLSQTAAAADAQQEISSIVYQRSFVDSVVSQLRDKQLRGGKDDSYVVLLNLREHFSPMQEAMAKAAPLIKVEAGPKAERLNALPLLMKGHLLELQQAITSLDAKEQLKEVEEVQETMDEFLEVAQSQYTVPPRLSAMSRDTYFGALTCDFWGLQRIPGSNRCESK